MTPDEFCGPQPVALYRHFDRNGELLYVGITFDPNRRWLQHLETSPWARFVSDVTVHWAEDRRAARKQERRAIAWERPLFNRARPRQSSSLIDHQLAYLRTGVSGLPRRVRCSGDPSAFCISCGPDYETWLDSQMEQTA